jgi:DNA-directed RNA polymerase specialized sigma24 family protein
MHPRPVYAAETAPIIVLREIYRHYLSFRDYVAGGGDHILEHSYLITDPDGSPVWTTIGPKEYGWVNARKVTISFSFWDLHRGLKELAPRKKEAFFYNVILDQRQRTVASRMGITTVSVGQYTKNAMIELLVHHVIPELSEAIDES